MSGRANEPVGGHFFKCTRGNCNAPLAGPHEQDAHNHAAHLAETQQKEVSKTYGDYSYSEVNR